MSEGTVDLAERYANILKQGRIEGSSFIDVKAELFEPFECVSLIAADPWLAYFGAPTTPKA
ncbi:MAG: hypothetical protein NZM43_09240 [Saprospiraceae bacterium]|nr:hypothetical protein [Saprospiraceae bacterium]MDW8484498.1 hypothetical protein [Saprospiraceae bacterium]